MSQVYRLVFLLALCAMTARGATFTWRAAFTGDWADAAGWTNLAVPGDGDDAELTNAGSVTYLSAPSSNLNSVVIGRTLIFTNWGSALRAGAVTVRSGGFVTLPPAFTNNGPSNNIHIVCSSLAVDSGGSISADARGYLGGTGAVINGHGPGGGLGMPAGYTSGAGHGGRGGRSAPLYNNLRGGGVYGSATQPDEPGSGGGGSTAFLGGSGGGVIRIQAAGPVAVNGTISANGAAGQYQFGSGGAGGSIWIDCQTLAGTGGLIRANGGDSSYWPSGAGGGGRIAVNYTPAAQAAVPRPGVRFLVRPGAGWSENTLGYGALSLPDGSDLGTLAFPDNAFLDPTAISHVGQWLVPGFASLACDTLSVTDGWVRFPYEGFALTVTNSVTLVGGATADGVLDLGATLTTNTVTVDGYITNNLTVANTGMRYGFVCFTSGPVVSIGGDLVLTNRGTLFLGHAVDPLPGADYGSLLSVTGGVFVHSNSWIYPYTQPLVGMTPLLRVGRLWVAAGGGISADRAGYAGGFHPTLMAGRGPGGGLGNPNYGSGGGHGARGGRTGVGQSNLQGGEPYGSATNPVLPGSGGGGYNGSAGSWGGNGGGVIRLIAAGAVTIHGTLSANGGIGCGPTAGSLGGGGAGGSIRIDCSTLVGATGLVRANGGDQGNWPGGGGGGGRIAVHYSSVSQAALPRPTVRFTVSPGLGWAENTPNGGGLPPGSSAEGSDFGTLYFTDLSPLNEPALAHRGQWIPPDGITNLSLSSLVISNGWIRFPAEGFVLAVSNDVVITGPNSALEFANSLSTNNGMAANTNRYEYRGLSVGPTLAIGGSLTLTNGARLAIESGPTNSTPPSFGALVDIGGALAIGTNSWIYPRSHPTNGGSVLFRARDVLIQTNAGFRATGLGYVGGDGTGNNARGPGRGSQGSTYGGGGAYGGSGGASSTPGAGGTTYGQPDAPMHPGSGGGSRNLNETTGFSIGGKGGGLVRIVASGRIALDGSIAANGNASPWFVGASGNGGGGAGGGIFLSCRSFFASPGASLAAAGAAAAKPTVDGGGGGGRIGVWRSVGDSNGLAWNVSGGIGYGTGAVGTVWWGGLADLGFSPTNGLAVVAQNTSSNYPLRLWNSGLDTNDLYWSAWADSAWITIDTTQSVISAGQTNALALTVDATGMNAGWYTGAVTFVATNMNEAVYAPGVVTGRVTVVMAVFDAVQPTVSFVQAAAGGDEAVTSVSVAVTLSRPAPESVWVDYSAAGGSATGGGTDYELPPGTMVFTPGAHASSIEIAISDDIEDEPAETIVVGLSAAVNATLGAATGFTYTIRDNDQTIWRGGTGDWFAASNWSGAFPPAAGSEVAITSASALVWLTNSTPALASLVVRGTLMASNWDTCISADSVTILSNGVLTCTGPLTNSTFSNRVWIAAGTNVTVALGGRVDADARGFIGAPPTGSAQGPGAGGLGSIGTGCGGGHGGRGGDGAGTSPQNVAGNRYGSVTEPLLPGSGGGAYSGAAGGHGGGAIRIDATAAVVTVDGTITANGQGASYGGGSGGSILLRSRRLAGGGALSARGGNTASRSGMGGGGRIAIQYDGADQAAGARSVLRIDAGPGNGLFASSESGGAPGEPGSIWLPDRQFLAPAISNLNGRLYGFTEWATDRLTVDGCWVEFGEEGFALTVTNDVEVRPGARLGVNRLACGRDLTVTNGTLYLYGGFWARVTNGSSRVYRDTGANPAPELVVRRNATVFGTNATACAVYLHATATNAIAATGTLVRVDGTLQVASNAAVYAHSDLTNGGSALFRVGHLLVDAGGRIDAGGRGFRGGEGYGPTTNFEGIGYGAGRGAGNARGGGYGGTGGYATATSGQPYGSSNAPIHPGSGGRAGVTGGYGGRGGGLIRVEAGGLIRVDGMLLANGEGGNGNPCGGGSGGGIYLRCRTFAGSNGVLSADGGAGSGAAGGGGGGGRIAVWRERDASTSMAASVVGRAQLGNDGTIVWGLLPPSQIGVWIQVR